MSIGFGVFLGLAAIAVVILFGFTRDRWRWKRIAVAVAAVVVLIPAAFLAVVWGLNESAERERSERLAAERERFQISVDDPFATVMQRQGVADTIIMNDDGRFVAVYWPDFRGPGDADRAFFFGPDSLLTEIRFMGDRSHTVAYEWIPVDGVTLGTDRDSVEVSLGQPCSEEIDEADTLLEFPTATPGVLRFAGISHGAQRVIRHGWVRGTCPRN